MCSKILETLHTVILAASGRNHDLMPEACKRSPKLSHGTPRCMISGLPPYYGVYAMSVLGTIVVKSLLPASEGT
jgi:hypothetical protein